MPKNMSFALTTDQFRNRTKTVTRRFSWWDLKPGEIVMGVEKAMGLKRGEKLKRLGQIRIVSVRQEPVDAITDEDVALEGFPTWTRQQFIELLTQGNGHKPTDIVNRIEFEYIDPLPDPGPQPELEIGDSVDYNDRGARRL